MSKAVYGLCTDEHKANAILTALRSAGFTSEISVLQKDEVESRDMSLKENAIRGAKIGSVLGGLVALTIPGLGAALAIGPLLAALTGAAAGGAVGGLAGGSGAVGPSGLPDEIERRLHEKEILIAVHTDDANKRRQALDIFNSQQTEYVYERKAG
jgi:hypothetical protein